MPGFLPIMGFVRLMVIMGTSAIVSNVSDAERLCHLIESRGRTQAKVATETDLAESTISEILAGKHGLNRKHIETLARYSRVSPAVFLSA